MSISHCETPSDWGNTRSVVAAKASPGRSRWFSPSVASYVGIDIGEQCVRVATLKPEGHPGGDLRWADRHQFALPTRRNQEMTPEWLHSVVSSIPLRLPRCIDNEINVAAIALPISWTHYQTVVGHDIPRTRQRCDEMFSASVFHSPAHLCHWPVVGAHYGKPSGDDQYVIAATAEQTACQIADLIWSSGYTVQSILPHSVVLAHGAEPLTGIDAQCVLWLSHTSALIAVRHQSGVGLTRSLPSVPESILQLDQPDRPLDAHALRPYLSQIASEFKATARYAARADIGGVSKKPILIAGPLTEIQGVDEIIATQSNTPVAVWSYLGAKRPATIARDHGRDPEYVRRRDSSFAGALSLAFAAAQGSGRGYGR